MGILLTGTKASDHRNTQKVERKVEVIIKGVSRSLTMDTMGAMGCRRWRN